MHARIPALVEQLFSGRETKKNPESDEFRVRW